MIELLKPNRNGKLTMLSVMKKINEIITAFNGLEMWLMNDETNREDEE